MPHEQRQHSVGNQTVELVIQLCTHCFSSIIDTNLCLCLQKSFFYNKTYSLKGKGACREDINPLFYYFSIVWFYHRSGSTHTIFFCSSQMTVRSLVSREAWSHQESGSTLRYRHGSLSSSGSSFCEHTNSCSSDCPWRCSLDLEKYPEFINYYYFMFFCGRGFLLQLNT